MEMFALSLWSLSTILQIVGACFSVHLAWLTRDRRLVILVLGTAGILALRRGSTFATILSRTASLNASFELAELVISLIMVAGVIWIAPQLLSIGESRRALRRSEAALRASVIQRAALLEVARQLNVSLDLALVLRLVAGQANRLLDGYSCAVYVLEADGKTLRPVVAIDPEYEREILASPLRVDGSLTGQAVLQRKCVAFNDAAASTVGYQIPGTPDDPEERIVAAPFIAEDKVLGAICISRMGVDFTEQDVALADTFATFAATALRNAQTHAELQREVEERVRAENALSVEEAYFQRLFESSPEAIAIVDGSARVTRVNAAFTELFGYSNEDAVGEGIDDLVVSAEYREEAERATRASSAGHPVNFESLRKRKDGSLVDVSVLSTPIELDSGEILNYAIYRDITEHKRAQEAQQRLEQHERLAAIGQLAAGIAHDFNNLLTGIIGFAELLAADSDLPHTMRPDLDVIVQEGRRGARLVKQILDFSRRSLRLSETLDLALLLPEVVSFWERTIPERVSISLAIGSGRHLIHGDSSQISQMLLNLALNSVDAMPDGGRLAITLGLRVVAPGDAAPLPEMGQGTWVELTVSDNGSGMTPEAMAHLFEPFFTTKGPGEGTGLGLAQVYGIVRQHEGYIAVDTQKDRGTTFVVYIPAAPESERTGDDAVPDSDKLMGHGETVLLVEDEPGVLDAGQALLSHLGYRVLVASDGQEAMDLYDRLHDTIDLIVSDLVMPRMGGAELYHLLAARNPDLRMIVTTGYPQDEQVRDLVQAGVLSVVPKPFSLEDLGRAVSRALQS